MKLYKFFFKRFLDFILSLILILIISPLLIIVALLVRLTTKGPIIYKQERMGKNERIFFVYKFRSMTNKKREITQIYGFNNSEITSIGKIIRRLKIDELPQLFNVLVGDMSIVGPRPALPSLINNFDDNGIMRIKVRPGLTGLAQVNGNIYLSWEERWIYDRKYIENISLLLDLKIIIKTIMIVLIGEDKFIKKPNV